MTKFIFSGDESQYLFIKSSICRDGVSYRDVFRIRQTIDLFNKKISCLYCYGTYYKSKDWFAVRRFCESRGISLKWLHDDLTVSEVP